MNVPRDKVYDVPAYMVEDELMVIVAETAHQGNGPSQDLIARELAAGGD